MPKIQYRNKNSINKVGKNPIADYLNSDDLHKNRLWRVSNGEMFTFENGEIISKDEFEAAHPIINPVSFLTSCENADHTRDYLK